MITDSSTTGQPGSERLRGISIDVAELLGVRRLLGDARLGPARQRSGQRGGVLGGRALGRGMEYEESRAYVPGDDSRTMDWRVMARTGEAHTKLFVEEKERHFLLAIDLSASMFFGTRVAFKSWAAAQVAAHLGWLASFAGDRIGGLVAAPGWHDEVRPGRTRQGLLTLFHRLAAAGAEPLPPTAGAPRLNLLLRELGRVARVGGSVALISDFLGLDDQTDALLRELCTRNRVEAWWIHDHSEVNPWPAGDYPVIGKTGHTVLELTDDDRWLDERQQAHRRRVDDMAARHRISLKPVCCNLDITRQVLGRST